MTGFIVFATLLAAVQFADGSSGYEEVVSRHRRGTRHIFNDWENAGGKYSTKSSTEQRVLDLQRGLIGKLEPVTSNTTFCQLRDPNGVQTPIIIGLCHYNIPVVTSRHEGNWTAVYGIKGKLLAENLSFKVTTRDPQTIEGIVDASNDSKTDEIRLACRVNTRKPQVIEFCHFTRPDGHVLSWSGGTTSDGYKTSTIPDAGRSSKDFSCGVIISQPKPKDYGIWRCRITDRENTMYGTVLHVKKNDTRRTDPNIVASNVYVRQSDTYQVILKCPVYPNGEHRPRPTDCSCFNHEQIKCTADAALSYCWFRSPSGRAYSVSASSDTRTPSSLPYVGAGLPLGDCAAEIKHASFFDQGEWTCNVGVVNGSEGHRSFYVHVSESYVIPERSRVIATGPGNIILSCNILPNATDRAVHYCRWIRPDGYGIYNDASRRYTTNTSNTQCKLIIREGYGLEDLGNWNCVAGLLTANSLIEESQATIKVSVELSSYQSVIGVMVAFTAMLMIIVCMLTLVHLRKKLRTLPADPPPYSVEPTSMPRFMKAESKSKEFRY